MPWGHTRQHRAPEYPRTASHTSHKVCGVAPKRRRVEDIKPLAGREVWIWSLGAGMGGAAEEGSIGEGCQSGLRRLWAKRTIYSYSLSAFICCIEPAARKK